MGDSGMGAGIGAGIGIGNKNKNGRERNAFRAWMAGGAIWAALLIVLNFVAGVTTGRSGVSPEWTDRTTELARLFDSADAAAAAVSQAYAPDPAIAPGQQAKAAGEAAMKIDINSATADELTQLPGIGPAKAKAIIEYRRQHGGFQTPDEMKRVKGIGDKTYASLEKFISVNSGKH